MDLHILTLCWILVVCRKSISGCISLNNGDSMNWKSFKQPIMEAMYIVDSEVAKEAIQFKRFVTELSIISSDGITLYCDNNEVIALVKELRSHQKSQHIERQFYIIYDYLEEKYFEVQKVDPMNNMVDLLTKPPSQQRTNANFEKMELRYMTDWLQCKQEIIRYMS